MRIPFVRHAASVVAVSEEPATSFAGRRALYGRDGWHGGYHGAVDLAAAATAASERLGYPRAEPSILR